MVRYDIREEKFCVVSGCKAKTITSADGDIWTGYDDMVCRYDEKGDSLQLYAKTNTPGISSLLISGKKIWIGTYEGLYVIEEDKEKLNAANMSVVKTLVSDGKVDEATDYVDVVDNLDLTYDEFMALSDEEKMAYLSGTSNWLTTLYPNVEMEEGIYEITVPLGVDMSATYNVTVSGSAETDSSETINVTIDQQQIVLANAQKFEIENLSAEMNSDGVSFSNEWDNKKIKAGIEKDGKIFLNSVIKNGESEMKYGASLDVSSISIQCEVTTQLEQNLAVTSSVKLEKSNNVDMKNWSAVRVEEEKENLDQVYWEMDPLYRESSMKKAEIFIADGISLTQILETLMQLAQYI